MRFVHKSCAIFHSLEQRPLRAEKSGDGEPTMVFGQPSIAQTFRVVIQFLKWWNPGSTANEYFANSSSFFSSCWLARSTSWESTHSSFSRKIQLVMVGCTIKSLYLYRKKTFTVLFFLAHNTLDVDWSWFCDFEREMKQMVLIIGFSAEKARHLLEVQCDSTYT